jgi:hypothetical protein
LAFRVEESGSSKPTPPVVDVENGMAESTLPASSSHEAETSKEVSSEPPKSSQGNVVELKSEGVTGSDETGREPTGSALASPVPEEKSRLPVPEISSSVSATSHRESAVKSCVEERPTTGVAECKEPVGETSEKSRETDSRPPPSSSKPADVSTKPKSTRTRSKPGIGENRVGGIIGSLVRECSDSYIFCPIL